MTTLALPGLRCRRARVRGDARGDSQLDEPAPGHGAEVLLRHSSPYAKVRGRGGEGENLSARECTGACRAAFVAGLALNTTAERCETNSAGYFVIINNNNNNNNGDSGASRRRGT